MVGLNTGKTLLLDRVGNYLESFELHSKKVNSIGGDENDQAFFSVSNDGTLIIYSLSDDFDTFTIKFKYNELSCVEHKGPFSISQLQFFIGTENGRIIYYEKGWILSKENIIFEGRSPILAIKYDQNVVCWGNCTGIHFKNFENNRHFGIIKRPNISESNFAKTWEINPDLAKPSIQFETINSEHRIFVAWLNVIQIMIHESHQNENISDTIQIRYCIQGDFYHIGLSKIANRLLICTFDLSKLNEKNPRIKILNTNHHTLFEEPIQIQEGKGLEIHYFQCCCKGFDKEFYIFNPKNLMMVYPITIYDRISELMKQNRFEEVFHLRDEFINEISTTFAEKIDFEYIEYLISQKLFKKATEIITQFSQHSSEKWIMWISKFKEIHKMERLIEDVPLSDPQLPSEIYSMFSSSFLEDGKYGALKLCLYKFKDLLNHSTILEQLNSQLSSPEGKEKKLDEKFEVLEILEILQTSLGNYNESFKLLLQMKSPLAFNRIKNVDLNLLDYLIPLIEISPNRTIDILKFQIGPRYKMEDIVKILEKDEKILHQFLHEIFLQNPIISKEYHRLQPALYIKYNPELLLQFLKKSDYYYPVEAKELCMGNNMLKETMFLLDKLGDKKEAMRILTEELNNIEEALQYLVNNTDTYNEEMWDIVINKAIQNKTDFYILMKYLDFYKKPSLIIKEMVDDDYPDFRQHITELFSKIKTKQRIFQSAKNISRIELIKEIEKYVLNLRKGIGVQEKCRQCKKPLALNMKLPSIKSQSFIHTRKDYKKQEDDQIFVFPCGHYYHEKCIELSKKQKIRCPYCKIHHIKL